MSRLYLSYQGAFQPYTRMTRRGKFADPAAQEYLDSQMRLSLSFKAQMARAGYDMLPAQTPLAASVVITRSGRLHTRDLDNEVKAVLDALQHLAFPNDCWIDQITVSRSLGAEDSVHVALWTLEVSP